MVQGTMSRRKVKTPVSVTIDTEIYEYLQNKAENEERSLSNTINLVLKKALSNQLEPEGGC